MEKLLGSPPLPFFHPPQPPPEPHSNPVASRRLGGGGRPAKKSRSTLVFGEWGKNHLQSAQGSCGVEDLRGRKTHQRGSRQKKVLSHHKKLSRPAELKMWTEYRLFFCGQVCWWLGCLVGCWLCQLVVLNSVQYFAKNPPVKAQIPSHICSQKLEAHVPFQAESNVRDVHHCCLECILGSKLHNVAVDTALYSLARHFHRPAGHCR